MQRFDRTVQSEGDIEVESRTDVRRGRNYHVDEALENAINVALVLGRPLLVSGQPGCGKTELGFAIARKLHIRPVHFFSAKSDVDARRLFYEFDALGRFQAAQAAGAAERISPRNFIHYQALGRAILDAYGRGKIGHLETASYTAPEVPTRSVVIIDEIDKAPRDFPNDLLNEIDQHWFRVSELALEQVANVSGIERRRDFETPHEAIPDHLKPIVVITSNNERTLPEAFLRRCVFHHILIGRATREAIVKSRLIRDGHAETDLGKVLEIVDWASRPGNMERAPGLAEAIDFASAFASTRIHADRDAFATRVLRCVSSLAKSDRDTATLSDVIRSGSWSTRDRLR